MNCQEVACRITRRLHIAEVGGLAGDLTEEGADDVRVHGVVDGLELAVIELARAEALISRATVTGRRYNAQAESEVDTEEF